MNAQETALYNRAHYLLRRAYGPDAQFREGQWEAIRALVLNRQRLLVVQRTGWGKSLVYFLAARLIRELGGGFTILISPLLSLMRNQIDAAERIGVQAAIINSTNYDQHQAVEDQLAAGQVDLLLISPERLANGHFREEVWSVYADQVGLLVVDEAHCISDWGHDFRPDYRRIVSVVNELQPNTPVLGTTATANNRVIEDVQAILGMVEVKRGGLTRSSLQLYVYPEPMSAAQRLAQLPYILRATQGSGIIYCTTTNDCLRVAEWLQKKGFPVKPYYAGVEETTGERREDLEDALLGNRVKALVASVALGMGFDKPDLEFIVHYQYPGSIISYYQQIGRAGRGIDRANIVLMHGYEDEDIQNYFIETAFPNSEHVDETLEALQLGGTLTINELLEEVNVRYSLMQNILRHLEIEGVVMKQKRGYSLVPGRNAPTFEHWLKVTEQRRRELAQMQAYLKHTGCLMHFIAQALDDPTPAEPCGRCQNCRRRRPTFVPPAAEIEEAGHFLRKEQPVEFKPRKLAPRNISRTLKGKIKTPNEMGLALCLYHDQGWGEMVRLGKYQHNHFSDDLVHAAADLLRSYWKKQAEPPGWVCAVPSRRHPDLVPNFAGRLAATLGLPFHHIIQTRLDHPPQKTMHNSKLQFANIADVFTIKGQVPAAPVLLVDDMVDSNWTFTVIGHLLRASGSGAVFPFALAKVSYGDPA